MYLPVEILENIFKYTDPLTIFLFQSETNILTKYFVEKYTNDDELYLCLDEKLKNINNSDLYILLSQLQKKLYLQQYCVNNLEYNNYDNCKYKQQYDEYSSGLYEMSSKIELSDNFKEIIEREKINVDDYLSDLDLNLHKVKESKNIISKIDFSDKKIEFEPINFTEIKKQYFENYSKNAIKSKFQINFKR